MLGIRKSNKILVFAHNCKWNGASGYKFAESEDEAVSRGYEVMMALKGRSPKGKVVTTYEYSHDVPLGSLTTYIALSDSEYRKLENATFDEVERFAERMEMRA